ncbi:MAG: class I SAM-dependent methyltransferase [Desulfobacteraceae bacterium]|jgi:SAM-dependent methyltransferase|nr:class I SAM-dependent methyltransferase [Desulfobacteraceae bacterium]
MKKISNILDNPTIWKLFRDSFDFFLGIYRKRKELLKVWGIAGNHYSVLDIACGIGQFSDITRGPYLGVDLNNQYIERAQKLYNSPNISFQCVDVKNLYKENKQYDIALLIGIAHHLDNDTFSDLLTVVHKIAKKSVVLIEVAQEQNTPWGKWLRDNDRGKFVRPQNKLKQIICESGFKIKECVFIRSWGTNTTAIYFTQNQ